MKTKVAMMMAVLGILLFLCPSNAAAVGPVCAHCYYLPGMHMWFCALPAAANEWCWVDVSDPSYCIDGTGGCVP